MPTVPQKQKKKSPDYAESVDIYRLDKTDIELENKIKVSNFRTHKEIIKKSDELSTVIESNYTDLDGKIAQNASTITQTAQQIRSEVSSQVASLNGRISANASSITQTAQQIRSEVSSYVTDLSGRISANTSSITQTAQEIRAEISSISQSESGLSTRVSTLEATSSSISGRVTAIEGDYVKSASIQMMVKKNSQGYLESGVKVSADNIDFTFTQSTNFISNNTTVMTIDSSGNLWIAGQYKNGIRVNNNGIERWNDSKNEWGELYASRCVRKVSSSYATLDKSDDFILSISPNVRIYLPSGCSDGKIITIKTIGHTTNIQPSSGCSIFTDHTIPYGGGGMDLNNYDRAEFVLYQNAWYWNAISL